LIGGRRTKSSEAPIKIGAKEESTMKRVLFGFLVLAIAFMIAAPATAMGRVPEKGSVALAQTTVDPSWDPADIQDLIDLGGTIIFSAGTYNFSVTLVVGSNTTLIGETGSVIVSTASGAGMVAAVVVKGDVITLDNMTVDASGVAGTVYSFNV
jgi:hypothetical protein